MSLSRRRFLKGAALSSAAIFTPALLVACGDDDSPKPSADASGPATPGRSPAASPAASSSPAATKRGPSKGELRASEPFLPATLDADSGTASSNLQSLGVSETLMRSLPDLRVEPWLASKLERLDQLTWKLTLRDDVTFTDGTKVDASAVKTSLLRSLEKQPSLVDLMPKETVLTAEGLILTIKTPVPLGLMPVNLATPTLATIKKVDGEKFTYTGPYVVTEFTARESIALTAYDGYRGGPAWTKTIKARQVADTSARTLAIQAGDVDVAQALLPSDVARSKSAGLQVFSAPWARQHMLVLNVKQAPFEDVQVRRAFSLAVDRDALTKGVMEGTGSSAYGIAPEDIGIKGVLRTQKFDLAEAKRVLDAAGWKPGADGIREKDGKKLSFKLGTYSGRAELEQFAVVLIDMAKAAGMSVSIEKFPDVEAALAANQFQATTYSIGSAAFGDISRLLANLYTPSPRNRDRYSNPAVNSAFTDYLQTSDESRQAQLLKSIQEAIGQDVPIIHLHNPYQIVATTKKLKEFAPHPLDSYKYTADMRLDS